MLPGCLQLDFSIGKRQQLKNGVFKMPEWFRNESFWKEIYKFLLTEKSFSESKEQIEKILGVIDVNVSSVLDLFCGPGRCSMVLSSDVFQLQELI